MESGDRHWLAVLFLVLLTAFMVIWGVVGLVVLILHEPPAKEVELIYPDPIEIPVFFTYEITDEQNHTVHFQLKGPYDLNDLEKVLMMDYDDGSDPQENVLSADSFSHTFPGMETYNVSLLVKNTTSLETTSFRNPIPLGKESNTLPVAVIKDLIYAYYSKDQPVTLSAEGSYDIDGEVIGYYWEFGDGTHSDLSKGIKDGYLPLITVQHTYDLTGEYEAKLWVMDNEYTKSEYPAKVTIRILNPA